MKKTHEEKLEQLKTEINALVHEWSNLVDGLRWLNGNDDAMAKTLEACANAIESTLANHE